MRDANTRITAIDAIAIPTVSVTPARVADVMEANTYHTQNLAASRNSAVIALLGVTALSLPVALDAAGMPVGLQLAGRHGEDASLIALAYASEQVLGTSRQRLGDPPHYSLAPGPLREFVSGVPA
jgi:aspartyl-tRNA(Asn)/glutamyl-tRNA(Gln) amidotransferase subunit A